MTKLIENHQITTMEVSNIANSILQHLEKAWNTADGAAFGEVFTAPCDFVDIRGTLHQQQSPESIGQAHQGIFNSIYKNSKVQFELLQAQLVDEHTILLSARSTLDAPLGPLTGINNSTISMVLANGNDRWGVRLFHNTLVMNGK